MSPRRRTRKFCAVVAALAVVATAVAWVAAPAAAASQTDVYLQTDADELGVGERAAVDVVVSEVDGGVGAYNVTLSLDNERAIISDVSVAGNAELTRIDVAEDGSSARLVVALMETPDTGAATIATVAVEGISAGTSDLDASVTELADESGRSYAVDDVGGLPITVVDSEDSAGEQPTAQSTAAPGASTAADSGPAPTTAGPAGTPVEVVAPADTVVSIVGGWRGPLAVSLAVVALAVVVGAFVRRR